MSKKPVGYHLLYAIMKLHALLPLRVLYLFSDVLYGVVYYVVRYRRKLVRKNLTNSFPHLSQSEIVKIEREFYRNFCDYFFETIKLLHISDEEMKRRMKFERLDLLAEAMSNHRSCAVYLGHYGNWEWVSSIGLHLPPQLVKAQIYQRISNRSFNEIFNKLRVRFDSLNIVRKKSMREIVRLRNEGKQVLYGFISDQRPPKYYDQYWTSFLNQDTLTLTGTERLAQQAEFAVVYLDIEKVKRKILNFYF